MLRGNVVHQLAPLGELFTALGTTTGPLEFTSIELKLARLKDVPHFWTGERGCCNKKKSVLADQASPGESLTES